MATTKQPDPPDTAQGGDIIEALMLGLQPGSNQFLRYLGYSAEQNELIPTRKLTPAQRVWKRLVGLEPEEQELMQRQQMAEQVGIALLPKVLEIKAKQAEAKANRFDPRQLIMPGSPGQPAVPPVQGQPSNLAELMQPSPMNADVVRPSAMGRVPLDVSRGSSVLTDRGRQLMDAVERTRGAIGTTGMPRTEALRNQFAMEDLQAEPEENVVTRSPGVPELRVRHAPLPTYRLPVPDQPGRPAIPPTPARMKTQEEWAATSGPVTPEQFEQITKALTMGTPKPKVAAVTTPEGGITTLYDETGKPVHTIRGGEKEAAQEFFVLEDKLRKLEAEGKTNTPEYARTMERSQHMRQFPPAPNFKFDVKTGEGLAARIGPMLEESRATALGSIDVVDASHRIKQAIKDGKVTIGPAAKIRNAINQFAQIMGATGATTDEKLVNTKNVARGLAQFALAARKQLKGQGQVSDFETRLILKAEAGEIEDFTLPELKSFIAVTEKLARKQYNLHQLNLRNLEKNDNYKDVAPFYGVPEMPVEAQDVGPYDDKQLEKQYQEWKKTQPK